MGLADRQYMRDPYHPPNVAVKLIVVLIICFVVESLLIFYGRFDVIWQLGLTLDGFRHGKVWQLITFQFLHVAPWPWHVLFNCLGLYFFGRRLEEILGPVRFLTIYFLSGTIGGLLQIATTALLPHHTDGPVVGASAGICGIIAVFCSIDPMQELTTWIYFFPVTIRARYFLMFLTLYSLFGTLIPFDSVANGAHLGGILTGIAYVRWGGSLKGLWAWIRAGEKKQPRTKAAGGRLVVKKDGTDEVPQEEFISREVDPILEKISAHGIQSLTEQERRILEAARNKMAKR
jgi:membrane associated rhomboid family serine protease